LLFVLSPNKITTQLKIAANAFGIVHETPEITNGVNSSTIVIDTATILCRLNFLAIFKIVRDTIIKRVNLYRIPKYSTLTAKRVFIKKIKGSRVAWYSNPPL
jgi:hypothetical protein